MQKFYYPVCETKEEFEKNWKIDNYHGTPQDYGFHDGWDINLKTGANTDLGKPIYACLPFKRKFFHYNSHLTSGFGRHILNEVIAPFDGKTYWFHFAHMEEGGPEPTEGNENTPVGTIGQTGRPRGQMLAHLHFAIFKKLPEKLDMIATSKAILDEYWVDPQWFFEQLESSTEPMITIPTRERDNWVARSVILDGFEGDGYKSIVDVRLALETNEDRIKTLKKEHRQFLIDMSNIIDPNTNLPELPDDDWLKTLAKIFVNQFSEIQDELKKKEDQWQKASKQLTEENLELEKQVGTLRKELEEIRDQHAAQIENLNKQHESELDRLEKRIEQVSSEVEKNKEKKAENEKIGGFIVDLFNKIFKR